MWTLICSQKCASMNIQPSPCVVLFGVLPVNLPLSGVQRGAVALVTLLPKRVMSLGLEKVRYSLEGKSNISLRSGTPVKLVLQRLVLTNSFLKDLFLFFSSIPSLLLLSSTYFLRVSLHLSDCMCLCVYITDQLYNDLQSWIVLVWLVLLTTKPI